MEQISALQRMEWSKKTGTELGFWRKSVAKRYNGPYQPVKKPVKDKNMDNAMALQRPLHYLDQPRSSNHNGISLSCSELISNLILQDFLGEKLHNLYSAWEQNLIKKILNLNKVNYKGVLSI